MKTSVKKAIKFAAGVCAALVIVTIGAVVAGGTAVKAGITEAQDRIDDAKKA